MIPKFNYSYNFKDLIYSCTHLRNLNISNLINYFKCDNIFFTNYARSGLYILLKSLSKNKVLKVGVQAFTCHTIFDSINRAGCELVFLDINTSFSLDIENIKDKINEIDVLIVTHTFGIPSDMQNILKIAKGKIIIEDCAHALFSKVNDNQVGFLGDASLFSIGYGKYPSIGPGGIILINNRDMVSEFEDEYSKLKKPGLKEERINIVKNYIYSVAFSKYLYGFITYPLGKKLERKIDFIGKNSNTCHKGYISNINIFNKNIYKYLLFNKLRCGVGLFLENSLNDYFNINFRNFGTNNFYIFPLLHKRRDDIVEELFKEGFESGKHFAKSILWAKNFGYVMGTCPQTEQIVNQVFTIPTHHYLNAKSLKKLIKIIRKY